MTEGLNSGVILQLGHDYPSDSSHGSHGVDDLIKRVAF